MPLSLNDALQDALHAHAVCAELCATPERWPEAGGALERALAALEAGQGAAPHQAASEDTLRAFQRGLPAVRRRLAALEDALVFRWYQALSSLIDAINSASPQGDALPPLGPLTPELGLFSRRMSKLLRPEDIQRARAFRPRDSDVLIATYPKSGTTWLQHILHGLRSGGSLDFDNIHAIAPDLLQQGDLGEQPGAFRIFKTHFDGAQMPATGKAVVCIRRPADVLLSAYNFFGGWTLDADAVDVSTYAFHSWVGRQRGPHWWSHLMSWWPRRGEDRVLLLIFEDLLDDLAGQLDRVARFVGVSLTPEQRARIAAQSSYAFMKSHRAKFDTHHIRAQANQRMGLPAEAGSTLVNQGRAGRGRRELPADALALLEHRWRRHVQPMTGCVDYEALCAHLRAERAT